MFLKQGIIKSVMAERGFKHRRSEDQFTIKGEYAQNLQYVFSDEKRTAAGLVVDLVYFSFDVLNEKLVIGLYRENPEIDNGVYENSSMSVPLAQFNKEKVNRVLDKLITPIKGVLK